MLLPFVDGVQPPSSRWAATKAGKVKPSVSMTLASSKLAMPKCCILQHWRVEVRRCRPVTAARLILGGRLAPLASLRISSLQHSGASSLARGARQIAVQKTVHNTVHS